MKFDELRETLKMEGSSSIQKKREFAQRSLTVFNQMTSDSTGANSQIPKLLTYGSRFNSRTCKCLNTDHYARRIGRKLTG